MVPNLRFKYSDTWYNDYLGKITNSCGGGTPSTKKPIFWKGDIPWISSSDIYEDNIYKINITRYITNQAIDNSATKLCPKESICIVSRVGVGKVAVTQQELCTSQDFFNITDCTVNKYFLAYQIQQKIKLSQQQGTSIKGITTKEIQNFKIWFPSRNEQVKIADFLYRIDERIQTQIKIIDDLLTVKNGISNKLFKLQQIESSNHYLFEYLTEGDKTAVDTSCYKKITVKLNNQGLAFSELNREMADTRPFYVRHKGELIIGKQNYFNGSIAIVTEQFDNCICSNAIMSFKIKDIYSDFLYYQISNNNYLNSQSYKANGTGQKELSEKEFLNFKIWCPQLEVQQKIVNCFKSLDLKIENEKAILNSYFQEKSYLLNNMFI